MQNDQRRLWSTLLFVILLGTSAVVIVFNYVLAPRRLHAGTPAASLPGGNPAISASPGGMPAAPRPESSQLLAAGDGRAVWMVRPVMGDNNTPGYELLRRAANTGEWLPALHNTGNGVQSFWSTPGLPRALALLQPAAGRAGDSIPYILCDSTLPGMVDAVYSGSLEEGNTPQKPLPPGHLIKAAAGGYDQLFAITYGPPVATATRPWDPLRADHLTETRTQTAPKTAATTPSSSATGVASAASNPAPTATATAASNPATAAAPRAVFNTYWYPPTPTGSATQPEDAAHPAPGDWCLLPPLTPLDTAPDDSRWPTPSSYLTLTVHHDRLLALWVDPRQPGELVLRTLDYRRQNAPWSAPGISQLPADQQVPNASRLFTVTLDQTLYIFWSIPTGSSITLHGGWLKEDAQGRLQLAAMITPLALDPSLGQVNANDVAVGASENSIVVVAANRDNVPHSMVFDNRGTLLASAKPILPESPHRDVQIGQNIALIVLVLMLVLSLWQWRQKPMDAALPKGLVIAPVHLRALAFFVDAALPYAAVLIAFGEWNDGGYTETFGRWMGLLSHPEEITKSLDVFAFLGIYLAHVALAEMFFRRSLGKALVGLQVLMLDGKSPTVAAVLVRNLVRVPETAVGVALLYIFLTDKRQRLGDLLARTVVVAEDAPAAAKDADPKD